MNEGYMLKSTSILLFNLNLKLKFFARFSLLLIFLDCTMTSLLIVTCSRGYDPDSLPYFKIFPEYIATLAPGSEATITNSCWTEAKVTSLAKCQTL